MGDIKLIELEIEETEYYNYYNIYYIGDYIPEINLRCYKEFYYEDKQKINYFIKNKDRYLFFIKDTWIAVIDKEYVLSNMDLFYNSHHTEKFCKFIKYHLIKDKLNKN